MEKTTIKDTIMLVPYLESLGLVLQLGCVAELKDPKGATLVSVLCSACIKQQNVPVRPLIACSL